MNLRLPKSALALCASTCFGVTAAVSMMPSAINLTSNERDSARLAQSKITEVSTIVSTSNQATELVPLGKIISTPATSRSVEVDLSAIDKNWDIAYVPILLESIPFLRNRPQAEVIAFLEDKTKQNFGSDIDKWRHWIWKQKFEPHPDLAKMKSKLYSRIDPRFEEYFSDADGSTIRLDEIRWGGVRRDGIPPLNKPQMISAAQATYLGNSDVVFGVEINGDARCYPKRILAWHEMFKDTIGGESVCGVY